MLEVATTTTPRSNSAWNSRPRIIASAMSFTWNSSKHSSAASAAIESASGGIGSSISGLAPLERVEPRVDVLHEAMEVDALLAAHVGGGEEQVHQHGLPAAHLAHDVQAVRRSSGGWARGGAGGRTG